MVETVYTISSCPISIALLGDLHGRPYDMVIGSLRDHHPQMIAIAGDIVYGSQPEDDNVSPLESQVNALPFLEGCVSIAPTYLSLGNHEWMLDDTDLDSIMSTGVTVLDNSWVELLHP